MIVVERCCAFRMLGLLVMLGWNATVFGMVHARRVEIAATEAGIRGPRLYRLKVSF